MELALRGVPDGAGSGAGATRVQVRDRPQGGPRSRTIAATSSSSSRSQTISTADERTEINAVLAHLDQQPDVAVPTAHLRCQAAVKMNDATALQACTSVLATVAPRRPQDDRLPVVARRDARRSRGGRAAARQGGEGGRGPGEPRPHEQGGDPEPLVGVAGAGRGDAGRGGSTGSAGHGRVPPPADDESSPRALGAARETRTFVHESAKPPRAVAKWLLASDRSKCRVEIDRGAFSRNRKHAITFLLGHWSGSALAGFLWRQEVSARGRAVRPTASNDDACDLGVSDGAFVGAAGSARRPHRHERVQRRWAGRRVHVRSGRDVLLVLRRVSRRRRARKSAHRQECRRIHCGFRRQLAGADPARR